MPKAIDPQSLLPLTPAVFQILLALCDQERHGYGIMREVEIQTGGQLRLGPGTLYGCIKRMLEARLVEESEERPDAELDDERRRYYRITDLGQRVSRLEARRLEAAVAAARAKKLLPAWRAGRNFGFWIADFGLKMPVFEPPPIQNPKSAIQNRRHAVALPGLADGRL